MANSPTRKIRRPGKSKRANAYAAGRHTTADTIIVVSANWNDRRTELSRLGSLNTWPHHCRVQASGVSDG